MNCLNRVSRALVVVLALAAMATGTRAQERVRAMYPGDLFATQTSAHQATALFLNNLMMLQDSTDFNEEILNRLYVDLSEIISPTEQKVWQQLKTNRARVNFIITFWRQRDPTSGTFANERLFEHYKRLLKARQRYGNHSEKGYDYRGSVYVRYGEPDQVYEEVDFNLNAEDMNARNPMLSWFYYHLDPPVAFDFVMRGDGYVLTYNLGQGLDLMNVQDQYKVMKDILARRRSISPALQAMSFSMRDDPNINVADANDVVLRVKLQEASTRYGEDMRERHQKLPPVVSTYFSDLSFEYNVSYFENADSSQSYVVAYGIADKKIKRKKNSPQTDIVVSTFLSDPNYRVFAKKSTIAMAANDRRGYQRAVHRFDIDREDFYIFVQVLSEASKQLGKQAVVMKHAPRPADSLGMSSILLADAVQAAGSGQDTLALAIQRNGLWIRPTPLQKIRKEKPPYLYFEVYGLRQDNQGGTKYEIAYIVKEAADRGLSKLAGKINPFDRSKTLIELTETRQGNAFRAHAYVQLDFSKLDRGRYDLYVQVKDRNSGLMQRKVVSFELQ